MSARSAPVHKYSVGRLIADRVTVTPAHAGLSRHEPAQFCTGTTLGPGKLQAQNRISLSCRLSFCLRHDLALIDSAARRLRVHWSRLLQLHNMLIHPLIAADQE